MVHGTQVSINALVFTVTSAAIIDAGVKSGWLPLQQVLVACVATDALGVINAVECGMAGIAMREKRSVCCREVARTYPTLQM